MELPLVTRLYICAFATFGMTLAEFVLSHFTHSITLLVVANQSFYNLLTLITAAASSTLMSKDEVSRSKSRSSFGWGRLEAVGSLCTLVFLGSLSFGTTIEALQTISHTGHLDLMHQPDNIFILACVHFIVWLAVLTLIGGYTHNQWRAIAHEKKVPEKVFASPTIRELQLAHIFRDLASCGLLMVTTVLVFFINEDRHPEAIKYIDPCISLLSILIIVITSWPLSHKLATILLQNSPVDVQKLKAEILFTFPQIFSVHEFHTWSLMHGQIVANLHVTYQSFDAYNAIHLDLERYLRSHGINQVTIQPEFPGDISDDQMINSALKDCCYLNCHSDWCEPRKCCDETQKAQINTTVII